MDKHTAYHYTDDRHTILDGATPYDTDVAHWTALC